MDDSEWPLVRVTFGESIGDAEWAAYLDRMSTYPDRRERYVTLTDARSGATPNATQRKRASELIERERERTVRWNVANATVFTSPLIRGVLTAIEWAAPSPVPMKSFATPELAREWLAERYREATGKSL
ncbi:MAG: hypothetical protein JJ863_10650 [Deltaproteobacteria bacterium]|nr:hypothetical protein [Deltaproteobacteria bacterium]